MWKKLPQQGAPSEKETAKERMKSVRQRLFFSKHKAGESTLTNTDAYTSGKMNWLYRLRNWLKQRWCPAGLQGCQEGFSFWKSGPSLAILKPLSKEALEPSLSRVPTPGAMATCSCSHSSLCLVKWEQRELKEFWAALKRHSNVGNTQSKPLQSLSLCVAYLALYKEILVEILEFIQYFSA